MLSWDILTKLFNKTFILVDGTNKKRKIILKNVTYAMRGQLMSDPSFVVPLEASTQQLEARQAIFLQKGCPDRLSGHTPPKLKLDTGEFESFKVESEGVSPFFHTWVMLGSAFYDA